MNLYDPEWLTRVLTAHGKAEGASLDCFGSSYSPDDFLYFTVYPDQLWIDLNRIWSGLGSFYFRFILVLQHGEVTLQRVLREAQGSNKRIRKELGEPYAKSSIGIPFDSITAVEHEWVEIAIAELQKCWPA